MTVSAKIVVASSLVLFSLGAAQAQQTVQPCEGTLCDLYYGGKGGTAAPANPAVAPAVAGVPAGATPLMAPSGNLLTSNPITRLLGGGSSSDTPSTRPPPPPSEPASASNSYMHMGTGGLLGDKQQRCSGTLCDTFYGSSPAEPEAPVAGQRQAAAGQAEPAIVYRHIPHESEIKPKCSSPAADPWRCLRK